MNLTVMKRNKSTHIDTYWSQILETTKDDGSFKFPTVGKVVKAALTLSHGNADVERNFSSSGNIMSEGKSSLTVRTLNAILTVKTILREYENKPQNIEITKELLQLANLAGVSYHNFLEQERRKKEIKDKEEREKTEKRLAAEEKKNWTQKRIY